MEVFIAVNEDEGTGDSDEDAVSLAHYECELITNTRPEDVTVIIAQMTGVSLCYAEASRIRVQFAA